MPKCDFNKALRHRCSPVNLLLIFRTPFLKNTSGWLILKQGLKQNEIGSSHVPTKHELSHSTVKVSNRKAISTGLYKTTRNYIHFIKH